MHCFLSEPHDRRHARSSLGPCSGSGSLGGICGSRSVWSWCCSSAASSTSSAWSGCSPMSCNRLRETIDQKRRRSILGTKHRRKAEEDVDLARPWGKRQAVTSKMLSRLSALIRLTARPLYRRIPFRPLDLVIAAMVVKRKHLSMFAACGSLGKSKTASGISTAPHSVSMAESTCSRNGHLPRRCHPHEDRRGGMGGESAGRCECLPFPRVLEGFGYSVYRFHRLRRDLLNLEEATPRLRDGNVIAVKTSRACQRKNRWAVLVASWAPRTRSVVARRASGESRSCRYIQSPDPRPTKSRDQSICDSAVGELPRAIGV